MEDDVHAAYQTFFFCEVATLDHRGVRVRDRARLPSRTRSCALDVANCMPNLHDSTTASSSYIPASAAPSHLNNTGCRIKYSEGKGRGVYGTYSVLGTLRVTPRMFSNCQLVIYSVQSHTRIYLARDQSRTTLLSWGIRSACKTHCTRPLHIQMERREDGPCPRSRYGSHPSMHLFAVSDFPFSRFPIQPLRQSERLLFHRRGHRVHPIQNDACRRTR
jgi:hypothetical protein